MEMKLVCIMACRNEEWVLGLAARAVLMWCDELVILLHACEDRSGEIAMEMAIRNVDRVTVLVEPDNVWREMAHRQLMLETARSRGATHIVYVDADEVLTANLVDVIRGKIEKCPAGHICQLPWIQLRGGLWSYHGRGLWADQFASTAFRDDPIYHWAQRDGYDFHHRHPMGRQMPPYRPIRHYGGLMHLQMVSDRRLRAKQALYKMTEVIRWPGREPVAAVDRRYNMAVYGTEQPGAPPEQLDACPAIWWEEYIRRGWFRHLDESAPPWQEDECIRLWQEHGPKKFEGLDLFGVIRA
jgi:hypothetical protein